MWTFWSSLLCAKVFLVWRQQPRYEEAGIRRHIRHTRWERGKSEVKDVPA